MIKGVIQYIKSFLNRAGGYVLISTIVSRLLSFFTSFLVLKIIDNEALGVVLYTWNIISFFTPFIGLGLHQSYLRYGALLKSLNDKEALLYYILKNGILGSLIVVCFIVFLAFFVPFEYENSARYLMIMAVVLFPLFLMEIIKIRYRLDYNNKKFSLIEVVYNVVLIVLATLLSYIYAEKGYLFALVFTPIAVVIVFYKALKIESNNKYPLKIVDKEFWMYGIVGGLSNVVNVLLVAIDILLIGTMMKNAEYVTIYKYLTIIPFSLMFVPRVFITTDYVWLTENYMDASEIVKYQKKYLSLFLLFSLSYMLFTSVFSNQILSFFDMQFIEYSYVFLILNVGVCGVFIFRGLYANLLSAIGEIKMNLYTSLIAVFLNLILNWFLIPKYGVLGAAITTASLMWITGFLSYIFFKIAYEKVKTT